MSSGSIMLKDPAAELFTHRLTRNSGIAIAAKRVFIHFDPMK